MPMLSWSQLVAAGAVFLPLDGWMFQYVTAPGMIEIFSRATAVGMVQTVTAGQDTLVEESPVNAGGVAGTQPSRLNTEPIQDRVATGDYLKLRYRNPTAGGITVDGVITLTFLGA